MDTRDGSGNTELNPTYICSYNHYRHTFQMCNMIFGWSASHCRLLSGLFLCRHTDEVVFKGLPPMVLLPKASGHWPS